MNRDTITGVVLAGGLGRRMGGIDKGLVDFRGRPLIAHALERLQPQVASVVISANQNLDRYAAFGVPVVPDAIGGFAGPLAGLHAALTRVRTEFVVTVPCDSPFMPVDLVARLAGALATGAPDAAVARTLDQAQPVFALLRRGLQPNLERFLAAGGRKVDAWHATLAVVEVPFDDVIDAFRNFNTAAELATAGVPLPG